MKPRLFAAPIFREPQMPRMPVTAKLQNSSGLAAHCQLTVEYPQNRKHGNGRKCTYSFLDYKKTFLMSFLPTRLNLADDRPGVFTDCGSICTWFHLLKYMSIGPLHKLIVKLGEKMWLPYERRFIRKIIYEWGDFPASHVWLLSAPLDPGPSSVPFPSTATNLMKLLIHRSGGSNLRRNQKIWKNISNCF